MRSSGQRIGARAHFLLLATAIGGAAAVAAGCTANSSVATGPTQLKCQVALAAPSSNIGPEGGTLVITVTTSPECPWGVSSDAAWLSDLSPVSGQGSGTVEFRAAPNPLPAAREGDIVVNESRLRVSQQAACRYELRPGSLPIDAGGGSREIAVSAPSGCSWTAATDANWISFTTPVARSGDGQVGVSIAPHRGDGRRQGTIVVGNQRLTVTQEPAVDPACAYLISSSSQGVLPSGGVDVSASVTVASGCAWTASSSVAWVTVIAGASGTGKGSVTFRVAPNPGIARTGTVTIAGQTFTVTQVAAAPCTYAISPASVAVDAKEQDRTVAVSAGGGCAWTATSHATWIRILSGASGSGSGSVTIRVERNKADGDRIGTVSIAGRTFTVRQDEDD